MSQILEIKSKSIEDAITNALEQLSVSREDIEVEVIENPVKGFLGLNIFFNFYTILLSLIWGIPGVILQILTNALIF